MLKLQNDHKREVWTAKMTVVLHSFNMQQQLTWYNQTTLRPEQWALRTLTIANCAVAKPGFSLKHKCFWASERVTVMARLLEVT